MFVFILKLKCDFFFVKEFLDQRKKSLKRKRDNDKDEFSNKKNMQVNYLLNGNAGGDNEKKRRESDDEEERNTSNKKRDHVNHRGDFKAKNNKKLVKFGNKRKNGLNHTANTSKAKFFGFSSKKRAKTN